MVNEIPKVRCLSGKFGSNVPCRVEGKQGQIVLDQIRTVDKSRLVKKITTPAKPIQGKVISKLIEMFSE